MDDAECTNYNFFFFFKYDIFDFVGGTGKENTCILANGLIRTLALFREEKLS